MYIDEDGQIIGTSQGSSELLRQLLSENSGGIKLKKMSLELEFDENDYTNGNHKKNDSVTEYHEFLAEKFCKGENITSGDLCSNEKSVKDDVLVVPDGKLSCGGNKYGYYE